MGLLNFIFGSPNDDNRSDDHIDNSTHMNAMVDSDGRDLDPDDMYSQYEFDGNSSFNRNRTHSGNGTKL